MTVIGLLAARRAAASGDELAAILLTAFITLAVSPLSWTHHWVWAVPTLALLVDRALAAPGNSMLLAGLLLFAVGAAGYLRGLSIPLTGRIAESRQRG